MQLISSTYVISIFPKLDLATVPTVVNDLLQSDKESNIKIITEAIETIVKFSFASIKDPKATGKEIMPYST
jgi:hypothetical protein